MNDKLVAIYCLCDDILKGIHHREDLQRHMNDAEIMTVAIVSMLFFSGNFEHGRCWLSGIPKMLSKSRFNRRLHQTADLLMVVFAILGERWKELNTESIYSIDSFPIPVCDNIRISSARIYKGKCYRGYIASKRRYFYGIRLHMLVTKDGQPVEFFLEPGSFSDVCALDKFAFDLPEGVTVYGDKAYNDYEEEDLLKESANIQLLPIRKKNSKRALPAYVPFIQEYYRKWVEIAGSLINRLLPKKIHAVTPNGFALKIALFLLTYSISCLWATS